MNRLMLTLGTIALTAISASAQQKGADEAAIGKMRSAYETAAGSQNAAAIAKLFAPDGVEMPPNAPAVTGRAAIEKFHQAFARQWMIHGMTIASTSLKVSGDMAYDIGTYKQGLMPQSGGGMVDDKGKYVVLLRKDASGAWLITHAIYNSDNPPPAPKK